MQRRPFPAAAPGRISWLSYRKGHDQASLRQPASCARAKAVWQALSVNASGASASLRLRPLDAGRAPGVPGIYAWYVATPFSVHDWKPQVAEGVDQAVDSFLGGIIRYAGYFGPESLDLKARGTYEADWKGSITAPDMRSDVDRLRDAAEDVDHRRVLVTLLNKSIPDFASPAYIGVAVDLQTRLRQHLADYEKARAALKRSPDRAQELQRSGKNLGARLAGAGVPMEHLSIVVMPVDLPGVSDADAREAAETAEWILQRIFRPAFGRR